MVVTATNIKLKGLFALVRFIRIIGKITKEANAADGLIFVKFKRFNTLTGWKNYEAMKTFRSNGNHLNAMQNIKSMGKAKSITWETESEPSWKEALERLNNI